MTYIIKEDEALQKEGIGGKARNLARLGKLHLNIPAWIVIPEHIVMDQLPEEINEEVSRFAFDKLEVPRELLNEIAGYFGSGHKEKYYAVRSSAMDEDSEQFSFAGQFETFLYVPFEKLKDKIKAVWQSGVSERVMNYRKSNDLPLNKGIAVIVQEMVPSDIAGVGFGMDPSTGEKDRKIIAAVFGLGEGIVSGDLNADTYTVTPNGIEKQTVKKEFKYVKADKAQGLEKVRLKPEFRDQSTLNQQQLMQISGVLEQLEKEFGSPQDIEFAYVNNELFLLQTRPITGVSGQNEDKGEYIIWDNSNIIESYPGITTPLTFSFIVKMYEQVYRQFVHLMGVRQKEIEQNADVFANTLGLVRGRVYYNLLNWYKMLAMLPGYSINAAFMENMMGVKERFDLKEEQQMTKGLAWYRIVVMSLKMLVLHFQLPGKRKKFKQHLDKVMQNYKAIDFEKQTPSEIIRLYKNFQDSLLLKWKAPLINDFFAMIWFGLLEKQCKQYCPEETNLHNDLLCGSKDIISVEPVHKTIAIARNISKNDATRQFFKEQSAEEIWQGLEAGKFPDIKSDIDEYLDQFGERCVGELKLETVSYARQPAKYIKLLSAYIEQDVSVQSTNLDIEIRRNAEEKMDAALHGKPLRRWWYQLILNKAREIVSSRENLRYERTRGFGMVRKMFRTMGQKWAERGELNTEEDIFYLKLEEILAMEDGQFNVELDSKIKERRAEFEEYKDQPPPKERFYTYGKEFKDEFIYSDEKMEAIEGDLKGIGCCPGKVKGKVKVIIDPEATDSVNGDILVTSSTDPGWVKLFPTAAAIIVERGSVLSHSAIVSREMGIPCIVGVTGLLRTVKTGDEVEMDGSTGIIKILR